MLSALDSILLGIIQGLTEWFPVSSSGHLVLAKELLGVNPPLVYFIYLHLGTFFVLLLVFWKDIKDIIRTIFSWDWKSPSGKLVWHLVLGTIVTAVFGLLFYDSLSGLFEKLNMVAMAFMVTGILLMLTKRIPQGKKEVNGKSACLVGLSQGIALIPGISRSGITISTGMFLGIERDKLARYSFLLSLPAVLGASILESVQHSATVIPFLQENLLSVLIGVLASTITGYLCLKGLLHIIRKGKFYYFSYYCFLIGIVSLGLYYF